MKITCLHVKSGSRVWVKMRAERNKNASYDCSQMPELSATLEATKVNNDAGLLLHKRQDGGAQWLYLYTIHGTAS